MQSERTSCPIRGNELQFDRTDCLIRENELLIRVPSLVEFGKVALEKIFKCVNVFLLFCNYLHLEKGSALHLIKLESPSPKDASCQVWLKLAK